jgi:hypothetical protein
VGEVDEIFIPQDGDEDFRVWREAIPPSSLQMCVRGVVTSRQSKEAEDWQGSDGSPSYDLVHITW